MMNIKRYLSLIILCLTGLTLIVLTLDVFLIGDFTYGMLALCITLIPLVTIIDGIYSICKNH